MTEFILPQRTADDLLAMKKVMVDYPSNSFPANGGKLQLNLKSQSGNDEFIVNYRSSAIKISHSSQHLRVRKIIGLARLDLDGPPHTNPDGVEISPRHLHIYKEGFGLKFAYEISDTNFKLDDTKDSFEIFLDFVKYCNCQNLENLNRNLI